MILIQICTLYRPRQASMSPYNLFGKSLFSHFHTEPPIPARNYFKNLNLILQYTNKNLYKSSLLSRYFQKTQTGTIGTRTQQVNSHHRSLFNHYPFHSLNLILQYTNKMQYKSSFFFVFFNFF